MKLYEVICCYFDYTIVFNSHIYIYIYTYIYCQQLNGMVICKQSLRQKLTTKLASK